MLASLADDQIKRHARAMRVAQESAQPAVEIAGVQRRSLAQAWAAFGYTEAEIVGMLAVSGA